MIIIYDYFSDKFYLLKMNYNLLCLQIKRIFVFRRIQFE